MLLKTLLCMGQPLIAKNHPVNSIEVEDPELYQLMMPSPLLQMKKNKA